MGNLFEVLTQAVEASPVAAVGASLLWGILSVVLSPCHLASIPLIVGFVDQQGRITTRRAFMISSLFSTGILITITIVGVITAVAGQALGDVGRYGNYIVAVVFLAVGLNLLDVIPMPWSGPGNVRLKRRGGLAAFLLGLIFGAAHIPLAFAFMTPMLGVTMGVAPSNFVYGVLLLTAYGIGHCSVIVMAGTFTGIVQRYLNWNERSRGAVILKRVCGGLVILGGIHLVSSSF